MGRRTKLALRETQALNRTLVFAKSAPAAALQPPSSYLRALRCSLRMTQSHVARRARVSRSLVAAAEAGRTDVQLGTLRRLFDAMFCDLIVAPKARKRPSDAYAERKLEKPYRPWD
jgi:transcriptional regulator with XRE-family HTH domain